MLEQFIHNRPPLQLRLTSDDCFAPTYPPLIPCPVLTLQLCPLCSGDMDWLCNKWECGLSITLPCFISDQVPLFPHCGIKLMDGSINWQPRVTSPAHSNIPGVLSFCPNWLFFLSFCVCVFISAVKCLVNAGKKRGSLCICVPRISNPQGNNLAGSSAKPNTSCTSCLHHEHFL